MHPNAFLRTFWSPNIRPHIFVAMSFQQHYDARFKEVFEPAIGDIEWDGQKLTAVRVDNSRTGDSILTDIMDGITHSRMILADVSSIGNDSKTGERYRNGNVMYEVGIALACRQPTDVLLVRDDHDKFLFDVSTIPHKHIDFTNHGSAREILRSELIERLKAQKFENDSRVDVILRTLATSEMELIQTIWETIKQNADGSFYFPLARDLVDTKCRRLLDKGVLQVVALNEAQGGFYGFTPIGMALMKRISTLLSNGKSTSSPAAVTPNHT